MSFGRLTDRIESVTKKMKPPKVDKTRKRSRQKRQITRGYSLDIVPAELACSESDTMNTQFSSNSTINETIQHNINNTYRVKCE